MTDLLGGGGFPIASSLPYFSKWGLAWLIEHPWIDPRYGT